MSRHKSGLRSLGDYLHIFEVILNNLDKITDKNEVEKEKRAVIFEQKTLVYH